MRLKSSFTSSSLESLLMLFMISFYHSSFSLCIRSTEFLFCTIFLNLSYGLLFEFNRDEVKDSSEFLLGLLLDKDFT